MTFMKHWGTIINFVLFAFICLIICIAVWMLSGDIQNWMKLVIYAITFAILFPLIRYIKRIRVKRREVLFLVLMVCALHANAQTEQDDKGILSGNDAALQTMGFVNHLMIDSAKYAIDAMKPNLLPTPTESSGLSYLNTYKDKAMHGIVLTRQHTPMGVNSFNLWRRGHLSISGATNQMPELMDFQTSSLSLHQDFGRFQLSASATANKYWMPMQSTLYTQYGFGGTIGYDLSDAVSLHAFGYYYAHNPLVGPAFSPYVSTTSYGGYADIRFSDRFGSNIGVRRYINPMSGRWTTEPIVTPYIKVKKLRIEFPVGSLLKTLIWGDRDNPLRFQPRPMPTPQPKRVGQGTGMK